MLIVKWTIKVTFFSGIYPNFRRRNALTMNKKFLLPSVILLVVCVALVSWGVTGHRAVGKIAENHLGPQAKAAVQDLLGGASLADVSTWPDEVLRQPEYRATAPWHYLNLPLGLSYAEFEKQVGGMKEDNVYSALLKQEQVLGDKGTTREQKTEALKFIVHFVGDLHQPMHISRAEDKGGNTIQVNYDGKGTNLHSLWDTRLIEHEGLTYEQLADKYGQASAAQVKQWQSDPLMRWIWESYAISSKLYAEVDAMKSRSIDDPYYQAHITIIHQRLEQAGIRLAGVLNTIFKNGLAASSASTGGTAGAGGSGGLAAGAGGGAGAGAGGTAGQGAGVPKVVEIRDIASHVGDYVIVSAKVYGYKTLDNMTLVNLGAAYPDQALTVVLRGEAKEAYKGLDGQMVSVTGKVAIFKDKPEIVVTDPKLIGVK